MSCRKVHEPFTLPKFGELQTEINEMCASIKLHHYDLSNDGDQEKIKKARESHPVPTWENVVNLFSKIHNELNKERINPVKY